jgi:hypothetical protein
MHQHLRRSSREEGSLRINERLIDALSLLVTLILLPDLLLESLALVKGVVELGVGVADLLGGDKGFESLAEARTGSVALGEGGHDLGVANWMERK